MDDSYGGSRMSTIKTTNITHGSNSGTSNVVLDSSGNVTIAGNTTTSGNISPTGDLIVASGKGLDFTATAGPTNSTGTATTTEKLLDFEEGTWTPYLGGENGDGTITYTTQAGRYVKIGSLVNCFFYIAVNAVPSTPSAGTGLIKGLPYTVLNDDAAYGGGGVVNWYNGLHNNALANGTPMLAAVKNQTYAFIKRTGYGLSNNGGVVDAAWFTSSDYWSGNISYIAA